MGAKRAPFKILACIDFWFSSISFKFFQDLDGEGLDITSDDDAKRTLFFFTLLGNNKDRSTLKESRRNYPRRRVVWRTEQQPDDAQVTIDEPLELSDL
ncbi:hypothetical protein ANCCAN_24146 [Ancylostoma caninum]|uniref:Uncharacterized protein n=1 Tax=Ancylostoma caninum TaxID=29170 RepID=A0A368FGU6_ANCCA|nr:hypothetical protein ANCCAN_24146 [Ancylostoma caninum]